MLFGVKYTNEILCCFASSIRNLLAYSCHLSLYQFSGHNRCILVTPITNITIVRYILRRAILGDSVIWNLHIPLLSKSLLEWWTEVTVGVIEWVDLHRTTPVVQSVTHIAVGAARCTLTPGIVHLPHFSPCPAVSSCVADRQSMSVLSRTAAFRQAIFN